MRLDLALALALCALAPFSAAAAGFDCAQAAAPVEKAICADPALSLADFVLTERHRHLVAHCAALPGGPERAAAQRRWVAETRAAFAAGEARLADLQQRYQLRNEDLARALDACSLQRRRLAPLRIHTVARPGSAVELPWVEAPSPEIARRINDAVFSNLLDGPAPARLPDATEALPSSADDARGTISASYRILRNDGRLLLLEISAEGCGAYCEAYTVQWGFDARSGRPLETATLFTEAGERALKKHYAGTRAARARALLAHAKRERNTEPDALALYQRCANEWSPNPHLSLPTPELDAQGQWRLPGSSCSFHATRPFDLLDGIHVPLTPVLLNAHLSPYGKSLLLAQGDVRDPAPPALQCTRAAPLTPPPDSPFRGHGLGVEHRLLLLADGRLLAWGGNPATLEQVGQGYTAVAAGHNWSAALDGDGTLWTWGSNYAGALGDGGTADQRRPVAIGRGYTQVRAEGHYGLALRDDGSLWTWGGRYQPGSTSEYVTTPWSLGSGYTQIELGPRGELQAIDRQGRLWTWRGFTPSGNHRSGEVPRKLGEGFVRLAGHRLQAAYKADGSLWAWGGSLAAMVDTGGDGDADRPAQPVGNDFAQVVSAPDDAVAALKADGSLWLTHTRGRVTQLEAVGCGYRRVALVGASWQQAPLQVQIVALRDDGSAVAWPLTPAPSDPTAARPLPLGTGWQHLQMADGQWGNRGPELLLIDHSGAVWQRRAQPVPGETGAAAWLERVAVPKP